MQDLKVEQGNSSQMSDKASKEEFVGKEMGHGAARKGLFSKWENAAFVKEQNRDGEPIGTSDKSYVSSNKSKNPLVVLYPRKFISSNRSVDLYENGAAIKADDVKECQVFTQSKIHPSELADTDRFTAKAIGVPKQQDVDKGIEPKEFNHQHQVTGAVYNGDFVDNPWSKKDEFKYSSSELWKDHSVKTVFPLPKGDVSTSYDTSIRAAIKEQVDEVGSALYFAKNQGNNESKAFGGLGFPVISEKHKEELPRLPPVKLKSDDKPSSIAWEEKYQRDGPGSKTFNADSTYLIGSFQDVPIGQEISSSGGRRLAGGNWFSVSQGITEDTSDLASGFATIGDGLSEYVDYPNDYWDSDEYEDDDDVGYMRQPIEDESWFLAHEIDYPSDNEKKTNSQEKIPEKNDDDDLSFAEEDLSRGQYFNSKNVRPVTQSDDMIGQYDGQLMDEELNFMHAGPMWKGVGGLHLDDLCVDEDQHGSVSSIGVGINSDVADFGRERELDGISSHDSEKKYVDQNMKVKTKKATCSGNASDGGFSFPPPRADQPLTGLNKAYNSIVNEEKSDLIPPWRQKGCSSPPCSSSPPVKNSRDEDVDGVGTTDSRPSTLSNYGYAEQAHQVDAEIGGSRVGVPWRMKRLLLFKSK